MELPILFLDSDIVAVNKPSGLLVHRTLLDRHETRFALQMVRDQLGARIYPVHRLDRPTSGVLIFARSAEMARRMVDQWGQAAAGSAGVVKNYLAVVRGFAPEEITVDYPLKEELDPVADRRADPEKGAQSAMTILRRLRTVELSVQVDRYPTSRYSLVKASPLTGRKHQIRRHLRHLRHPIIGDVEHGVGKHNRYFAQTFNVRRLLLACTEISFQHPRHGHLVRVSAPLDAGFQEVIRKLGWGEHA